jgi:serine/threonine-protein kinase
MAAPLPQLGDVVGGRYELTEVLGTGGMGAVFAATHQGTGREVAIKVLLPSDRGHRSKRDRLARFVREAKAAGRIRHPNVVDVYDVEGDADPPYIVMERLHGHSLWQRVKSGPMEPEEAVRVLLAAMRGVSEAQRQGVIHRDLKPDNIFLATVPDANEPIPKVLDFGVSRIISREENEARPTTLTRSGYILGTPSYMPLEQLRGQADIDARADVYALGVILYEALCAKRPYEAHNDHELVIRMATEPPIPLRTKAPNVDAALSSIVMKALAREATDRHQDVDSFAQALERWLAGDRTFEPAPTASTLETASSAQPASAPQGSVRAWSRVVMFVVIALAVAAWLFRASLTPGSPERGAGSPEPNLPSHPSAGQSADRPPVQPEPAAPPAAAPVDPAPAKAQTSSTLPSPPDRPLPRPRRRPRQPALEEPADDRATKLKPEDF